MQRLMDDRRAVGNIARLALGQALAGANATVIFATGAILGATLAPDPSWATLPISIFVVGMAMGTLPTGWLSRLYGRRIAFLAGTFCGMLAGLLAAWAIVIHSFPLFCMATFFGGLYGAVVMSFRFAAADGVSGPAQPKALAWVMAGGVFAGVLGPQLVNLTMSMGPHLFMVSYLAQAGIAVLAAVVLAGVDLPKPEIKSPEIKSPSNKKNVGRPLGEIIRHKPFIIAVLCGIVSYGLMNLMMTSAPLAMRMCGLPLTLSNTAIEWHIIAMYGPSYFTGSLITRFGANRIAALGLVLTIVAGIIGLNGITGTHFVAALVALGLGWNFGFVGASSLVLKTHHPEERNKVQSFNDFAIFGTMALGSFLSGQVLSSYGWAMVCYVVLVPAALTLVVLLITDRPDPIKP